MNGVLPAPLLRQREGQSVRLSVNHALDEDTSIHWHGVLLPFQMDGVPGISFPGIKPRETFVYEFPIKQSGTFWYHVGVEWSRSFGDTADHVEARGGEPEDTRFVVGLKAWF